MVFPDPGDLDRDPPKDKAGTEKMGVALNKMVQEDPSFQVATDEDSGETLIKGMGELHLDIKVDILRRTHGVDVEMGKPQVAYRESITQAIEDTYTHKKQTGGAGQYCKIELPIEPASRTVAMCSNRWSPAATYRGNTGLPSKRRSRAAWTRAHLPAYPMLDVSSSSSMAVSMQSIRRQWRSSRQPRAAYRQSVPKASPQLLEPIMKIDVFTPDDHVGDVIGDLNRRRGMIKSQDTGMTGTRVKVRCASGRDVRLHR